MEFVATSQPSQDGDLCTLELSTFQPVEDAGVGQIEDGTVDESDSVGSSQPFEDGEEDLLFFTRGVMIPAPTACWSFLTTPELSDAEPSETDTDFDDAIRARQSRRARLIRRAPPVSPVKPSPIPAGPWLRSLNLVRRVTMPAEIERRRQRARIETRRIAKKIRALARATARLQRKHRRLCNFVRDSRPVENKENIIFSSIYFRFYTENYGANSPRPR
ncbi:hypothetical protein DFH09DRAFT_1105394 [Mycena vulgaris]|nr:hypothetical protein DFH09DRAFT_1105394 [Mycena vulgaris]